MKRNKFTLGVCVFRSVCLVANKITICVTSFILLLLYCNVLLHTFLLNKQFVFIFYALCFYVYFKMLFIFLFKFYLVCILFRAVK